MNVSDRKLPSLVAMRAFEVAGRYECFTKAADELSVTQSAVSRQIKLFEAELGVEMFVRKGRTVRLSSEGRKLHSIVVDAFGRLAEGARLTREDDSLNALHVSVESGFAARWLMPRLFSLMSEYPEIDLQLATNNGAPDLDCEDADLAIFYGAGEWGQFELEEIHRDEVFPVCSPALIDGSHGFTVVDDLAGVPLLHGPGVEDWRFWLQRSGSLEISYRHGPRFAGHDTLIKAAVVGLGIGLGHTLMVADDLSAGRLIELFDSRVPADHSYWLATPIGRQPHPQLDSFRSWLRSELASQRMEGYGSRKEELSQGDYNGLPIHRAGAGV